MGDKTTASTIPDQSRPGSIKIMISTDKHQGGCHKSATGAKNTYNLLSEKVTIGTWNVRTLYSCSKVIKFEYKLRCYKWDVIGLAKVR